MGAMSGRISVRAQSPDGYRVTKGDDEFSAQMAVAKDLMRRYRNTLRELAK